MTNTRQSRNLHIAYIGGGSRGWAITLMNDLAQCPDLCGEIRLYDIDQEGSRRNEAVGNWLQSQPGVVSTWRYQAVDQIEQALKDADFVFISILPGTLEMMEQDIAIAEKYGLYFPVGDTTGAPGLIRGIRSAMIFAGFAEAIATVCPHAWVINYTNPMSICTRTLTRVAPDLKVFGCCHEVFGTQRLLATLVQKALDLSEEPNRDEIKVNVLGINHFTWIDRARYQEVDLLKIARHHMDKPGVLRQYTEGEVKDAKDWFHDAHQIKFELFKRYGILAAAGDRHLSEFVPGFTRTPEELFRWGVIRTPISWRKEIWRTIPIILQEYLDGKRSWTPRSSGEEAIRQIKALLGLDDFVTNVNLANIGQISNLPLGVVVETNAHFSENQVNALTAGFLPPGIHSLVVRHVTNQEMILEAALQHDKDLAFQAIFNDPTTSIPIDQAWRMFNEMSLPEGWR